MNQLLSLKFPSSSAVKTQIITKGSGTKSVNIPFLSRPKKSGIGQEYKMWVKMLESPSNLMAGNRVNNIDFIVTQGNKTLVIEAKSSHKLNDDFIMHLPSNIRSSFKVLGLSRLDANEFLNTINKIDTFLKSNKISYTLDTDSFADPEYPDWMVLEIIIKLKDNFESLYPKVKSNVYDILGKNVNDKLYEKLIIKIEPL